MLTRRGFLSAAAAASRDRARAAEKTNIVFILTDDHGAWAVGAYGCGDIHTPNLDRLAAGGARFTRAYACTPVCSPSRMTYFTGRLPCHHGVQDWLLSDELREPEPRRHLDGQTTFSGLLAESGYTLGLCGKWHMGGDARAQAGFTSWSCVPGGGGPYRDAEFVRDGRRVQTSGFKDDFTADQGHCSGHHGLWGKGNASLPLNLYEESLHIPLIWNHPGHIAAGQVLTPMVSSYDFFPTLLDYAGVPAPPDARRVGRTYAAFLRGGAPAWNNELYFEYEYVRGIRTENLKYIERAENWPSELFDLEADPGERRDVLADPRHARQLADLRARLAGFCRPI